MRTTLNLNNDLLAQAKALAAREQFSLTRLIEEGLALRLRQAALWRQSHASAVYVMYDVMNDA